MQTEGYLVLPAAVRVTAAAVRALRTRLRRGKQYVFNGPPGRPNDLRRRQASVRMDSHGALREVYTELRAALDGAGFAALRLDEFVCIESLAGCAEQAPHCDHEPDARQAALPPGEQPLGVLTALEPGGARLRVWPGSFRLHTDRGGGGAIAPRDVELRQGDVLLFRGDLVHAGAAYAERNLRLHAYADSPAFPRRADSTYLVRDRRVAQGARPNRLLAKPRSRRGTRKIGAPVGGKTS